LSDDGIFAWRIQPPDDRPCQSVEPEDPAHVEAPERVEGEEALRWRGRG
jgi:hypothetical protein